MHLCDRTGRGQRLDVAMLGSWLATDDYVHYLLDGARESVYQGGEVFEAPGRPLMLNRALLPVRKLLGATYGIESDEPAGADQPTKARCRREAVIRWMGSLPDRGASKQALEKADLAR